MNWEIWWFPINSLSVLADWKWIKWALDRRSYSREWSLPFAGFWGQNGAKSRRWWQLLIWGESGEREEITRYAHRKYRRPVCEREWMGERERDQNQNRERMVYDDAHGRSLSDGGEWSRFGQKQRLCDLGKSTAWSRRDLEIRDRGRSGKGAKVDREMMKTQGIRYWSPQRREKWAFIRTH